MKRLIFVTISLFCVFANEISYAKNKKRNKNTPNLCLAPNVLFDMKSSPSLSMNIEAMTVQYTSMKQDLSTAFDTLQKNSDFGEVMLQKIMNLLDAEIIIVNHLLCGQHGALLQDAICIRNTLLKKSTPSVAYMYDKVLDLVTYDECINSMLYESGKCGCGLAYALNWHDKKDFLLVMRDKLEHYYTLMREMQCGFVTGASGHSIPIDSKNCLDFCPIIK